MDGFEMAGAPGTGDLGALDVESDDLDSAQSDGTLSDDELTALALAADPQAPIDDDAVPIGLYLSFLPGPLPEWYMPVARGRGGKRWRIPVVATVVVAFLVIDAFGLCNTFGFLTLA